MRRFGTIYLQFLEALTLSLLAERKLNGKDEIQDIIIGQDSQGKPAHYSALNARMGIQETIEKYPMDDSLYDTAPAEPQHRSIDEEWN